MDISRKKIKMCLIFLLLQSIQFELKSEDALIEVIDPITFVYKSDDLKEEINSTYRFENIKKKRKRITSSIFKLRLHCFRIKKTNSGAMEEGKKFLRSFILKDNGRFLNSWRFVRGPDINGVYLIEPIYQTPRLKSELNIENEIIRNKYAELFETCFSCAPPGIISKILTEHSKQVKYSGFSNGYDRLWDDADYEKMKRLCGKNIQSFSQESYDWMLPKKIFRHGVFGED